MDNNLFEHRLEKVSPTNTESGYVLINENNETWTAGWSNGTPQEITETWYQGNDWKSTLAAFRQGVADKLKQGWKQN